MMSKKLQGRFLFSSPVGLGYSLGLLIEKRPPYVNSSRTPDRLTLSEGERSPLNEGDHFFLLLYPSQSERSVSVRVFPNSGKLPKIKRSQVYHCPNLLYDLSIFFVWTGSDEYERKT